MMKTSLPLLNLNQLQSLNKLLLMKTIYTNHTYSYLSLRKSVGVIAILLPFVVSVITLFNGVELQSYYATARDIVVGALCAISLLMFLYTGYSGIDNWAGNAVGLFALGMAWFPPPSVGTELGWVSTIHFISGFLFFLTLSFFCLFLFTKSNVEKDLMTIEKKKRNKIYIICGIAILLCLALMSYVSLNETISDDYSTLLIYVAQSIANIAFGISWLVKGKILSKKVPLD